MAHLVADKNLSVWSVSTLALSIVLMRPILSMQAVSHASIGALKISRG